MAREPAAARRDGCLPRLRPGVPPHIGRGNRGSAGRADAAGLGDSGRALDEGDELDVVKALDVTFILVAAMVGLPLLVRQCAAGHPT